MSIIRELILGIVVEQLLRVQTKARAVEMEVKKLI